MGVYVKQIGSHEKCAQTGQNEWWVSCSTLITMKCILCLASNCLIRFLHHSAANRSAASFSTVGSDITEFTGCNLELPRISDLLCAIWQCERKLLRPIIYQFLLDPEVSDTGQDVTSTFSVQAWLLTRCSVCRVDIIWLIIAQPLPQLS